MATRKRTGGDDTAWSGPAVGGDPDAVRPPGAKMAGVVGRIGEHFWREMDNVPLSVPRWGSRARMNANIKWLLDQGYPEDVVKASFAYFRTDLPNLVLEPSTPCWDMYFRRRGSYLRSAQRGFEGHRPGDPMVVRKAGDIHVDNDRFRVRQIGEPVDTQSDEE